VKSTVLSCITSVILCRFVQTCFAESFYIYDFTIAPMAVVESAPKPIPVETYCYAYPSKIREILQLSDYLKGVEFSYDLTFSKSMAGKQWFEKILDRVGALGKSVEVPVRHVVAAKHQIKQWVQIYRNQLMLLGSDNAKFSFETLIREYVSKNKDLGTNITSLTIENGIQEGLSHNQFNAFNENSILSYESPLDMVGINDADYHTLSIITPGSMSLSIRVTMMKFSTGFWRYLCKRGYD
jgi:hypothetical protein